MSRQQRRSTPYLLLKNVNPIQQPTPNGRRVSHLQTSWNTPPPRRHTRLSTRIQVVDSHGDEAIQNPVPLWMSESTFTLEPDSLDGCPPQEILVVQVVHRIIEIGVAFPIQTIHNTGILGVQVNDVGARVRVPSLFGTGHVEFGDAVGVLGDTRHSNGMMKRW